MKTVLPVIQRDVFFSQLDNRSESRPPHCRDFTITLRHTHTQTYTHTHTHTVGLLWKRDRPFQGLLLYNTQHKKQTSMLPDGIRTHHPSKRASADHTLDLAATGTGSRRD